MATITKTFGLSVAALLLTGPMSSGYAQPCDINQKQVLITYAPQLCLQNNCDAVKKYLFLGNTISSYFKKGGTVEVFRSVGVGSQGAGDADVGFEYKPGITLDVLRDQAQSLGVIHSLSQLSPGTQYLSYTIRADKDDGGYKFEDRAEMAMPYGIGKVTTEVVTQVNVLDCHSCQGSIVITQLTDNKSRSTYELPVRSCTIHELD